MRRDEAHRGTAVGVLKVLWIATKPPWPPRDGGRLVQHLTLEALAELGVEITVVAPVVEPHAMNPLPEIAGLHFEAVPGPAGGLTRARTLFRTVLGVATGEPWTLASHHRKKVARQVARLLERRSFDVVHAEQLQAWPQTAPARRRGIPVVLRAQNVESDLWRGMAELESTGRVRAAFLRWQGRRLTQAEGRAVAEAAAVVALTEPDRERLQVLAPKLARKPGPATDRHPDRRPGQGGMVVAIPAPFPGRLPLAEGRLEGRPPVVLLGSGGWPPNRDAESWLLRDLWPAVRKDLPGAVLHVFGGHGGYGGEDARRTEGAAGVVVHPAPENSREVFVAGSILVVPLRLASGVRMKILEAWARGVPVVATPTAHRGLECSPGQELLEMEDAASLARALRSFLTETETGTLPWVERGRERLQASHDPQTVARRLLEVYRRVAGEAPSEDQSSRERA